MVPKHSSSAARSRPGSTSSKMAASLVAEALGGNRKPCPCRVKHTPTVRRSCHPSAGPTGLPERRSQTIVVARWLAMPTPATDPTSARAAAAVVRTTSAMRAASTSTSPGAGVEGRTVS